VKSVEFGLAREIISRECYFSEFTPTFSRWETVIDLGANTGVFTMLAASKSKKTIAVEAQQKFKHRIQQNAQKNKFNNVEIESSIVTHGSGPPCYPEKLQRISKETDGEIDSITMIDIFNKYSIDRVDFLKIDIEGSEFSLFDDSSWLDKVEQIGMEVHPSYGDPFTIQDILEKNGFRTSILNNDLEPLSNIGSEPCYIQAKYIE
ncbi:MAG: FkbM family methyltransferase, partial [Candidatus Paceibacteria bacterium]